MSIIGRCGGCDYFKPNVDPKAAHVDGFCHQGPPQLVVYPAGGKVMLEAKFPPVLRGDWCGAYCPPPESVS